MHECVYDQEEYLNLASEPVEIRLFSIIKNVLNHNRPLSHHITSSSTVSTMIPTPGVPNNGSAHAMIPVQPENPTIATSNTAIASQTAANTGNLLINANGPTDAGNSASFNASDGKFWV